MALKFFSWDGNCGFFLFVRVLDNFFSRGGGGRRGGGAVLFVPGVCVFFGLAFLFPGGCEIRFFFLNKTRRLGCFYWFFFLFFFQQPPPPRPNPQLGRGGGGGGFSFSRAVFRGLMFFFFFFLFGVFGFYCLGFFFLRPLS